MNCEESNSSGRKIREVNEEERVNQQLDQDYNLARWYSNKPASIRILLAASKGQHLAEAYVAILYLHGTAFIEQNIEEAQGYTQRSLQWVTSDTNNHNRYALFHRGCCLAEGRGLPRNVPFAVKCLTLSKNMELDSATHRLGLLLRHECTGYRVRQGCELLEQLALESRHPDAQYWHAQAELTGLFTPRNLPGAFRGFKRAAKQGHRQAIYQLGCCYAYNTGTEEDPQHAAVYFHTAAELGDPEAELAYAKCCKEGFGVPQNYVTAAQYYARVAERGNGLALHNLGLAHELGRGVVQNVEEALLYYQRAADAGHTFSKHEVQRLKSKMKAAMRAGL